MVRVQLSDVPSCTGSVELVLVFGRCWKLALKSVEILRRYQ